MRSLPSIPLVLALTCAAHALQERTVLRDVHVVDVETGRVLRDQALVIEGERIASMGPVASVTVPEGATVIEGRGRHVMPGLFDMHVHFRPEDGAEDELLLFLAGGVTTVQCMSGSPWHLDVRARVAAGTLLGPRVFTTGPTTAQLRVHTPEEAERTVREQKAAGYDGVKMYGDGSNTMPRETYHRLIATAHELGLRVVGHAPRNLPFSAVIEEEQDSIDHMEEIVYTDEGLGAVVQPYVDLQFGRTQFADHPELLGDVPDFRPRLREAVEKLARRVRDAGLHVTPTLMTFRTIQEITGDEIHGLNRRPELAYVHPTTRAAWTPERQRFRTGNWSEHLQFMHDYLLRNVELQFALVNAFHEAGVPLMTGTDAPFDFVVPGFALHEELAAFVSAGLSPLEALRAATIVPAQFLGVDGGTVAPGQRADLVLVDGNPLDDIGAVREIGGTCVRGRWLSRDDLDARLAAIATRNEHAQERVDAIAAHLDASRFADALAELRKGERDPHLDAWVEGRINERGYELLRAKHLDEAIALFRSNTEAFPAAPNTWDSLGEACLEAKRYEDALENYERALALNPANEGAQRAIDRIVEALGKAPAR